MAKHAADSDIENYVDGGFEKVMDEFDVDFVLGGHDHVYSRSYVLKTDSAIQSAWIRLMIRTERFILLEIAVLICSIIPRLKN